MEWVTGIRTAIDHMEEHLTDNINAQDVADQVYISPFFLQKGFSLMRELYQGFLTFSRCDTHAGS